MLLLGCGRSGTSIFGELFESLPQYRYYSEPTCDALTELDFSTPVAVKVPRSTPRFPAGGGLSFPLDRLDDLLPQPRQLFWIVRHPLDTICSLRVGISLDWGHHPRPPDWQEWRERPLLERCAHHWNYINGPGYAQVRDLAQLVYFEDLIADPAAFAERICAAIGLDSIALATAINTWARRVQDTDNEHFVPARTGREYATRDHRVRVGRWRENLTEAQANRLWEKVSHQAKAFGYLPPTWGPQIPD